ncbi:mRNA degradation protein [Paramyrothecium foliicola]|nr:mRNA degradation protein [Paramyrothecium foliicola]
MATRVRSRAYDMPERHTTGAEDTGLPNARTYSTPTDPKEASPQKQSVDEAEDIYRLQQTFESPPQVAEALGDEPPNAKEALDEKNGSGEARPQPGKQEPSKSRKRRQGGVWTTLREKLRKQTFSSEAPVDIEELDPDGKIQPPKFAERNEHGEKEMNQDGQPSKPPSKRSSSKSKQGKKSKVATTSTTFRPSRLRAQPLKIEQDKAVPQLSHHLDRVLFNSGVVSLQDERSRVFNFDPYLASIMPIEEFDFSALKSYVTSSKDSKLRHLSQEAGLKYCGSTSSMTSILSHFHYLLSAWRPPNYKNLSRNLVPDSKNFTVLTRAPAAAFLHHDDGVYAIDADKGFDSANILTLLGQSMEKLLTLPKEEFERYRKSRSHEFSDEARQEGEAYHYTKIGDMLIRSQLDAHDARLPGTGMFDLKTRAVVTIRMDVDGYEKGRGYEIRKRFGQWESFEREYYDMIRAAFLKYSLQVRLGRMDGIFVAYHNTQRIFGFQYISLAEMDEALHGTSDLTLGNLELKASVAMLNDLLNRATKRFPGRTLRLHVETRDTKVPLMYFIVEPVTDKEMKEIQDSKRPEIERFERSLRGFQEKTASAAAQNRGNDQQPSVVESPADARPEFHNEPAWREMMAQLEKVIETESLGVNCVRQALVDVLKHRNLLKDMSDLEAETHLDSLTEALTLHLHEANRTVNELEENALEDDQEDGSADVSGTGESESVASETEGLPEASRLDDSSEVESQSQSLPEDNMEAESNVSVGESAEAEPDSDASLAAASLKKILLKVTDGIGAKTQGLRAFEQVFADLVAAAGKQGQTKQSSEPTNDADASTTAKEAEGENATTETSQPKGEILGMYVTVRHKVNGEDVQRPELKPGRRGNFDWTVNYTITEMPADKARAVYHQVQRRRSTVFSKDPDERTQSWHRIFGGKLPSMTDRGKRYREQREQEEKSRQIEDEDVCNGAIALEGPILAESLRNITVGSKTSRLFCVGLFGSCDYPEVDEWSVPFPSAKPPGGRPAPSGQKPLKVVHYSDIHIDPLYTTGSNTDCTKPLCCRPYSEADEPGVTTNPAGPNGDHRCDSPYSLEASLYSAIKKHVPDAAFSIFTGDIIDHAVWNTTELQIKQQVSKAYAEMDKHLGLVYGTAGNHEAHPTNAYQPDSVGTATQWIYDLLSRQWSRWIGSDGAREADKFGAYSVKFPGGNLRVISLNTNMWYRQNYWLYREPMLRDPSGQLEWLVRELDAAEKAGENVYLMGHMPVGDRNALHDGSNYLDQIIKRYSSTIAAMFFGHTHRDEFQITYDDYDKQTFSNALVATYVGPSLTPTSGMPSFRVYDVDPVTFGVLDVTQYMADMKDPAFQTTGPVWKKLYSAKEVYGSAISPPLTGAAAELTAAFWHNVTEAFEADDELFDRFMTRKSRGWLKNGCVDECKELELCQLRAARSQDSCWRPGPGLPYQKGSQNQHAQEDDCGVSVTSSLLRVIAGRTDLLKDLTLGLAAHGVEKGVEELFAEDL